MNRRPLISVLIVSHKAGRFLDEAVQSIVDQTYPNWELVLVDNASADGSVARVAAAHAGDPRFHIIPSAVNLGPSGGACRGFSSCRGEYIARLDADDVARPDRLARQLALLESRPDLLAAGADVLCMDRSGALLHPRIAIRSAFLRTHGSPWESACQHSTLFFRRSAAAERFYNPTLGGSEDVEWISWLARDHRLGLVAAPLVYFRIHQASFSKVRTSFHTFTGAEVRLHISRASPSDRTALACHDFSGLPSDPRVALPQPELARSYLNQALVEKNFIAAAYFCTTCGQWPSFPGLLLRAWLGGRPWRDVLGLLLVRTVWPVWKRLHVRLWRLGRLLRQTPLLRAQPRCQPPG